MNPLDLPLPAKLAILTAFGLVVGSFLNVAIYRLPLEGQSVRSPKRSQCPGCGRQLTWKENIPLLSWLVQRGRCRGCAAPISWRYPIVELGTGLLFALAGTCTPEEAYGLLAVRILVICGLIVATFVDFAYFEIPDEISIGGLVLAPVLSLLVPRLHEATWVALALSDSGGGVDRTGALFGAVAGMAVGSGLLWIVGWLGRVAFRREAMGFGDVKLLGAAGGFVGPGGAVVALMAASLFASVAGILNIARFFWIVRRRDASRGRKRPARRALVTARIMGRYVPFGPYLAVGIGIALLYWNDVHQWLGWS